MTSAALRHLWAHRRASLVAFVLAVLVALFFAVRLTIAMIYWSDPDHLRQAPKGWMTPGYVARSWQVDAQDISTVLGLDPRTQPRGQTLEDIARARGVAVGVVIAELASYLASVSP